ncbi:FAD/FMN-containing dehydrogenase [Nakamurella panacisegetis]|uniref:Delta(24)-sterol reductase n=1 Tax=Nakamurella panacisegetis TaxID=1090615 RepID=A0A1H0NAN7_9ACTN|nr:FAD-binding oxidoreductase [Nakamurella panacisegetis]SDO89495.1 FAD/FMN-containing dehydrogenase [Nakamurella panacisegetis]
MSEEPLTLDPPGSSSPQYTTGAHRAAVDRLLASFRAVPPSQTVRLAKRTSNLFRERARTTAPGLDVSGLTGVLSVDVDALTADVAGMCTYEDLVAATLPFGLSPMVVPQLKTITIGGAVTGLGIESTSFRNGLVHESVLEMDILTGDGRIVTARPEGEHADLFLGFPNSYGSLGYATRVRIQLERVKPYVSLRHLRFESTAAIEAAIDRISNAGEHNGVRVDYLDGVVFSATESYLTLGTQTDAPGPVSDYTGQGIYYRSIQQRKTDRLRIHDYLWRWDTDWFWCSRAFGAQQRVVRRLWPKRLRRSSFYWKLVALDRRYGIADRIEKRAGRPPMERVVQDIEVPVDRTSEFLDWFLEHIPIEPIWLCPLRTRAVDGAPARAWPLYALDPGQIYVNVGFWSAVPTEPGAVAGATNRSIEDQVNAMDGRKSLYSDAFYTPEAFAELYGGAYYDALKARYDPDARLLGVYEKTVGRR